MKIKRIQNFEQINMINMNVFEITSCNHSLSINTNKNYHEENFDLLNCKTNTT